ncbi:MAG: hypothetical protein ACP5LD_15760, partial [Desulfomonilaceae bacterium]
MRTSDRKVLEEVLLLTGNPATPIEPAAEDRSDDKDAVASAAENELPHDITQYILLPSDGLGSGVVDSWAGDLVGRWLSETGMLKVSGWAVDHGAGLPARRVFLVHEGRIRAAASVERSRPDVAKAKSNHDLEYC